MILTTSDKDYYSLKIISVTFFNNIVIFFIKKFIINTFSLIFILKTLGYTFFIKSFMIHIDYVAHPSF